MAKERDWPSGCQQARAFKSLVKSWCDHLGLDLDDLAVLSLSPKALAGLSAFTDSLVTAGKAGNVRNVRWAVTEAHRTYEGLRKSYSLPTDFHSAFCAALEAKGWAPLDVIREVNSKFYPKGPRWKGTCVYAYVKGESTPLAWFNKSRQIVAQLEQVLGLPVDTLASRAFKGPSLIQLGNPGTIAYREHQSRRTNSPYALSSMPEHLAGTWREIVAWRSQQALRVRGELYVIKKGSYWAREGSAQKYQTNMLRFMGWLTLPPSTKPAFELSEEERWLVGKGMRAEDITFAHWFDPELLWGFVDFLRGRQHNGVVTEEHMHFVVFINSLVNHPYSYVKAHDKLAQVFAQDLRGQAWADFVETNHHQAVLKLARQMRKALSTERQRSPDEPLKTVFEDQDPILLVMELVRRMEENLSPACHQHMYSAQLRDITLFRMCLEVPLRASNLSDLRIGTNLVRDKVSGRWMLMVPKTMLKNHHSPHAYDIHREYSSATSLAMDLYLEKVRPNLPGAGERDWFFLTIARGPKRKLEPGGCPYQMMPPIIYWAVCNRTKQYFGIGMGPNLFRHLLATSILKSDPSQVETAAAVLNNSPDTIRNSYKHLTQKDGLRTATAWQEAQQAKFQKRFGRTGTPES
jgi:integrase